MKVTEYRVVPLFVSESSKTLEHLMNVNIKDGFYYKNTITIRNDEQFVVFEKFENREYLNEV